MSKRVSQASLQRRKGAALTARGRMASQEDNRKCWGRNSEAKLQETKQMNNKSLGFLLFCVALDHCNKNQL